MTRIMRRPGSWLDWAAILVTGLVTSALAGAVALGGLAGCGGKSDTSAAKEPSAEEEDGPSGRRGRAPDIGEEEDDDELQVEGLRGRLDTYDIQEGVKPHAGAIDKCFTENRGKARYLGGNVELLFIVAKDGTVQNVHLSKSDLGAWPIERCLLEVSRGMTFVKPKGGAAAEFTLPLGFTARTPPEDWDGGRAAVEVTDKHLAELATCADAGAAPASAWITVYVGTRGQVQSAGFATTAPLDEAWATCAEQKLLGWSLSDPQGRIARVTFAYPPEAM
jgi:hypothetical protein